MDSGCQEGRLEGGDIPLSVNYRPLTEETLTGKNPQLQALTLKCKHCIPCKKWILPATQPMRNCHHSELLLFSIGLLSKTTPLNFLILLHKITFLSFVGLAYGFIIACLSWTAILLLPNKTIFAGKTNDCFIFKVNVLKCSFRNTEVNNRPDGRISMNLVLERCCTLSSKKGREQ